MKIFIVSLFLIICFVVLIFFVKTCASNTHGQGNSIYVKGKIFNYLLVEYDSTNHIKDSLTLILNVTADDDNKGFSLGDHTVATWSILKHRDTIQSNLKGFIEDDGDNYVIELPQTKRLTFASMCRNLSIEVSRINDRKVHTSFEYTYDGIIAVKGETKYISRTYFYKGPENIIVRKKKFINVTPVVNIYKSGRKEIKNLNYFDHNTGFIKMIYGLPDGGKAVIEQLF